MNNKDLNWFNNLVDATYDNLDDSKKTVLDKRANIYNVSKLSDSLAVPQEVFQDTSIIDSLTGIQEGGKIIAKQSPAIQDSIVFDDGGVVYSSDYKEEPSEIMYKPEIAMAEAKEAPKEMMTIRALKWLGQKGAEAWEKFDWDKFKKTYTRVAPFIHQGTPPDVYKQQMGGINTILSNLLPRPKEVEQNTQRITELNNSLDAIKDYSNSLNDAVIHVDQDSVPENIPSAWLEPATDDFIEED